MAKTVADAAGVAIGERVVTGSEEGVNGTARGGRSWDWLGPEI